MGECDHLLRERLQAITEKHRIQEDIRQKKVELDQEKLKLQHLKKKVLREQWLLQDSTSHSASHSKQQQQSLQCDQQQAKALQLSIHSIEMEVESLERVESLISTNESFILDRLKTVEKSPEDIIKEAQNCFVPYQSQVAMVIPDVPESLCPAANVQSQPSTPAKALFAMEISVAKNMLTGESSVLSTADVPPEEIDHHAGLKVFDDGRKCVYALRSQQGSHDQSGGFELSPNEVEELLKSARMHHQVNQRNEPNVIRQGRHCFYKDQDERAKGYLLRNQGKLSGDLRGNDAKKEFSYSDHCQRKSPHHYQENAHYRQEGRHSHCQQLGNHTNHHYGNQRDSRCGPFPVANCPSIQNNGSAGQHTIRSRINGGLSTGFASPRAHDQKVVMAGQPQLCYTPAHHIPLSDYVSVDEEQLLCHSPPYRPKQYTVPYKDYAHCDRVPSPLYSHDPPFTILNAMDTTEPITAIFMGFQTTQDDSGGLQEFDSSLRAELVVIEDSQDNGEGSLQEKNSYSQFPTANGNGMRGRRTQTHTGAGIKKIQKRQKPCCSVC